jgi:hypothetical protein
MGLTGESKLRGMGVESGVGLVVGEGVCPAPTKTKSPTQPITPTILTNNLSTLDLNNIS